MVDIAQLLAPISEESPTGNYLKLDRSIYRALRNNYNAAQSSFRQLIETPDASSDEALLEANESNWTQLRNSTLEALTQSTKDLELLGWYISSQLFTAQPYQNLADSTKVLKSFIEEFWGNLHPTLPDNKIKSDDEQGKLREIADFRIKPLLQLVGESNDSTALFMPLQLIGLIDDITFGDYLRAERSGELEELKKKAQQLFNSDVEQTVLLLSDAYQNFTEAELAIAKECQQVGVTPISFRFAKANLADSINAIRFLTEDKFAFWPLGDDYLPRKEEVAEKQQIESPAQVNSAPAESAQTVSTEASSITAQVAPQVTSTTVVAQIPVSAGQIASRDQAFQELRKISEFFKQTEPHSPISFLLERAIRWGYMSLPELMQEMTGGNSGVMQQINQLTGMDNLDQLDLSDKTLPTSSNIIPTAAASNGAAAPTNQTSPVEIPTQEKTDTNQSSQTEASSTESSGNLNDFEW
ncbi:type VI secretion system ImpA family N-terminal domain-containing protein [Vibrio tubiashii]|uniref:type VI secretion system protein TssA n=1 Tax=Vibrio tubiashii TaxID=29498 RepID=UPI00234F8AAF|nr:type VI secretion system ImpA family N-terminal domain-containing protein [Vibrio tubiashii]WCP68416.1 type VI secretion system ImpA family N-terminal domain-containing protein [Vibrio tubiashii]